MKTRAAILVQQKKPLRLAEVEIPRLKPGQVLVKVMASGLCRSQINEWQGTKGPDPYLPHLLGHEGAGQVVQVGPQVKKVKPNDHVVLTWIKGNGMDVPGSQYLWGKRIVNAGAITTLSQVAVISENRLVKIPKTIPWDVAALLGCAIPTGAGMVFNTLKVKPGSSLAVFGVGGIGASAILAAKAIGCQSIVGVDVSQEKCKFATMLGATQSFHAIQHMTQFKKQFPHGVDFAIEASGVRSATEQAYQMTKDRGTLVIAGNLAKGETIAIDPFDLIKGKKIIGTWGGETLPDRDIPRYARMYQNGVVPFEKLITHRFSLEEIQKAFEVLVSGQAGRVLITFPV